MMRYSPAEIDRIQDAAADRITEILDALGMSYVESPNYFHACCPIHGGDNPRGWYWMVSTKSWRCRTQGCEKSDVTGRSSSVFGLVRGALWVKKNLRVSFLEAVAFVIKVLGLGLGVRMDRPTEADIEIDKVIREYRIRQKQDAHRRGTPLASALNRIAPDTTYWPSRGIRPETIRRYHIGYCDDGNRPFHQRTYLPVLDETGRYILGWSARSIFDKCPRCGLFHSPEFPGCPPKDQAKSFPKWRHSKGFRADLCLYNAWFARHWIGKTQTAVICEGPADVWAYEQAGIRNSVAIFGVSLSPNQRLILQRLGALTLIVTLDNDKAGKEAQSQLVEELKWYFRLYFVTPTGKDIGEMSTGAINEQIRPVLEEACRVHLPYDGG